MKCMAAGAILWLTVPGAAAQAPAGQAGAQEALVREKQQQAGAAYRALEQARYEAKLAEQDLLNAQDAHNAAQKQVDERKKQLDAAKKAADAAQAKVAQAHKRHENALTGVEQVWPKPAAK